MRCQECTVRAQKCSAVEAAELVTIEEEIKVVDGHAVAKYPFIKDPSVLQNNFEQVRKRAEAVERRLEKAGEMESYNKQLEDFIARGAISEISEEEMKAYQGPVNYVDHHPVHNPGSLSTPYRVVVNSSLDNNNQGCMVGFDELEKLPKFLGEVTKSEDGTKFSYTGTIAKILKLDGFEAKCMEVDHEKDEEVWNHLASQRGSY